MNRNRSKDTRASVCVEYPTESPNMNPTNSETTCFSLDVLLNIHSPTAADITVNGIKNMAIIIFASNNPVKKIIEGCFNDFHRYKVKIKTIKLVSHANIISIPTTTTKADSFSSSLIE